MKETGVEYIRNRLIRYSKIKREKDRARKERIKRYQKSYDKIYRLKNKARIAAKKREYIKRNRGVYAAIASRRFALFKSRIHPDIDFQKEKDIFVLSASISRQTGIKHEVDHIIPISKGGWHHHLNLQILPKPVNAKKNNNPFWEMKGYKNWKDVPEFLWPENLRKTYSDILLENNA